MVNSSGQYWAELVKDAAGFSSDSRHVRPGDIFVALRGRHHDGHDYLQDAVNRGAYALIVNADCSFRSNQAQVIKVNDTAAAHRRVAGLFRRKSQASLIAVAGSNGKTTTTQCVAHLCRQKWSLIATQGSQNGMQGIPKTLEQLRPDTELIVIEVGIDERGVMQKHGELLQPDICIITSIGAEHMERFESLEQVFLEESYLLNATLKMGGHGIIPGTDSWLHRLPHHPRLHRVSSSSAVYDHPYPHHQTNVALAAAAARILGMSELDIGARLSSFTIPDGRGQFVQYRHRTWIVRDHYNANPDSMRCGIEASQGWSREHGLSWHGVLGDMMDLGWMEAEAHRQLLNEIHLGIDDSLTLVGPLFYEASRSLASHPQVARFRELDQAFPGFWDKQGLYLLKGSRGMKMERLLPSDSAFKP